MQSRQFLTSYDQIFPGEYTFHVQTNGIFYGSLKNGLDPNIKNHFEQLDPFTMDDEQFNVVKGHSMCNLSINMTNSVNLARLVQLFWCNSVWLYLNSEVCNTLVILRSLILTAVENIHCEGKVDPVPMEYDTLRKMTRNGYIEHFEILHHDENLSKIIDDMEKSDHLKCENKFDAEFIIESINPNELTTVILQFYKVERADDNRVRVLVDIIGSLLKPIRYEYGLYTAVCYTNNFGLTDGIVLETIFV